MKPKPKPDQAKAPQPPKRSRRSRSRRTPAPPAHAQTPKQRDFNPDQIAALLDRREPQRQRRGQRDGADRLRSARRLGNAARLTQSEIDALRAQIRAVLESAGVGADAEQV